MKGIPTKTGISCEVAICQNSATTASPLCNAHRVRKARFGHPTRKPVDLKRSEGKAMRTWCANYIDDQLTKNEDVAIALEWLKQYVSQGSRNAGKAQVQLRRVYEATDDAGYVHIMAGLCTLVALSQERPNQIEVGLQLIRQSANCLFFSTTFATSSTVNRDGKRKSTSYYASPFVLDKVGEELLTQIGKELSFVASRLVRLSPYFTRKGGI